MLVAIMVSTAGHEFSLQSLPNIVFMPGPAQEISHRRWLVIAHEAKNTQRQRILKDPTTAETAWNTLITTTGF